MKTNMVKKITAVKNSLKNFQRPKKIVQNVVLGAIRNLKSPKGSSLANISKYINSNSEGIDVPDSKNLKLFLSTAVDRGVLLREDGKYIINASKKRRKKSRSRHQVKARRIVSERDQNPKDSPAMDQEAMDVQDPKDVKQRPEDGPESLTKNVEGDECKFDSGNVN